MAQKVGARSTFVSKLRYSYAPAHFRLIPEWGPGVLVDAHEDDGWRAIVLKACAQ